MHTSNAKHRQHEENVRALGCCITGHPNPVIHHPVGRKGRHNKVLIGPWFILPLREDYHVETPYSIHGGKSLFIAANGKQVDLFMEFVLPWVLVPDDVVEAIKGCGK